MPDNSHDTNEFLTKVFIYASGTVLGIVAKLATMNQEKGLTMRQVFFQSAVAFATAWVVWWMLEGKINENVLVAVSVVVGRFGDVILIAIGNALKQWIISSVKKDL